MEPSYSFKEGLRYKIQDKLDPMESLTIRILESKIPSNVKISLQKFDFQSEIVNYALIPPVGGSTRSALFKMAAATILDFENRSLCLH